MKTTADAEQNADLGLYPPVLAGKYRVREVIGRGGMGVVFAGEHLELQTKVAIKVLQRALAQDRKARARFLREARLAASIEGEHSTRIIDVGDDDAGMPYMVMEFLSGEPLDARLERSGKLVLADVATIGMQLFEALAEAHAKGLVHRDLKPGNLFLVDKPGEPIWVKVMDFGISKTMSGEQEVGGSRASKLTEPRTLLGSPEYMSPEQLRDSASVDARSDVWACGVLLFELLTGKMPFEGSSLPDLYARIVGSEPRTFSDAGVDGIPSAFARIVERCLRKEPGDRPRSVFELAVVLAPYASESARGRLTRIRAWCKADEPAVDRQHPRRRMLMGSALVAFSGVAAFIVGSIQISSPRAALPDAARREPSLATAPPTPLVPVPSSLPPDAGSSAVAVTSSTPSSSPPPRTRPPAPRKDEPRAKDLDGIDLIR